MSKLNLEELLNNQWEIDKVFGEVKRLNTSHNEYLDSKRTGASKGIGNNDEVKRMRKIRNMLPITFLLVSNVKLVLGLMGLFGDAFSSFLSLALIGLFILSNVLINKKIGNLEKGVTRDSFMDKWDDDDTYDALCEKRSLYHQMKKEQDAKVSQLSSEEYQEYLELLEEYFQTLNNMQEQCGENKPEEVQVLTESPKKRRLIGNFFGK